jgi:hypothetical protein
MIRRTLIIICISSGLLFSQLNVSTAKLVDTIHCKSDFLAQNYRMIDSQKGPAPLAEIRGLLEKLDGFKVVAQFDHGNAAADGRPIPLDGIIISYSTSDERAEAVFSKIESFNGMSVSCITRQSFDDHMNFLGL